MHWSEPEARWRTGLLQLDTKWRYQWADAMLAERGKEEG
jgi:hypothetical protein